MIAGWRLFGIMKPYGSAGLQASTLTSASINLINRRTSLTVV